MQLKNYLFEIMLRHYETKHYNSIKKREIISLKYDEQTLSILMNMSDASTYTVNVDSLLEIILFVPIAKSGSKYTSLQDLICHSINRSNYTRDDALTFISEKQYTDMDMLLQSSANSDFDNIDSQSDTQPNRLTR